jgi:hypothetical protein
VSDYRRFDSDRTSINTAASINNPGTRLNVGDITKGEVVTVEFIGTNEGSTTISSRRVGAALIGVTGDVSDIKWNVAGTKLTVNANANRTAVYTFWVF